ncbi:MAG: galactokinase, partial [Alphaproteobacteria bacterium]
MSFTTTEPALREQAARAFEARFGAPPEAVAFAPGRVNLLGEHTDYNGGLVLPMPLGLGIAVALGRGAGPGVAAIASDNFEGIDRRPLDAPASGAWSDYVLGSLALGAPGAFAESGVNLLVAGNLPVGAGLSSSAAVEVACLRGVDALLGRAGDAVETALAARRVENDFVGMPCGIMDQFAVSVGAPGKALFLDTRTLEHRPVPMLEGFSLVVIHSGVSHRLADDGYANRVAECKAACAAMGVALLSDLGPEDLGAIARLAPPLDRRARHIVTENQRVRDAVAALERGDAPAFAAAMNASHISQRDDFEVSVPEVDALVEGALAAGAIGARLTGGGFGGSVVALVPEARIGAFVPALET